MPFYFRQSSKKKILPLIILLIVIFSVLIFPIRTFASINYVSTFGTFGFGNARFSNPSSIAMDSAGNIYVVDTSNTRIEKFDESGNFISVWGSYGTGNGQFESPAGIAVDSSDNVYVTDIDNSNVQKFTSSGTYITQWGTNGSGDGQFSSPFAIAITNSGNVYVTDSDNCRIEEFDTSGSYLAQWGTCGSGPTQFWYPEGITIDHSGNIFVLDEGSPQIEKFDSNFNYLSTFATFGFGNGGLDDPRAITVDTSGNVYVSDVALYLVEKFDDNGNFIEQWGGTQGSGIGQLNSPRGLVTDNTGNVFVSDYVNNRVQMFCDSTAGSCAGINLGVSPTPTPTPEVTYQSQMGSYGGLKDSNNLAVDSSGNVFVLLTDSDTPGQNWTGDAVYKFDSSGNVLTHWGTYGTGNGQFHSPNTIAIDSSDNVYISDGAQKTLQKFDNNGNYISQFSTSNCSGFGYIAVDSTGNVFLSCSSKINKYSSAGTLLGQYGSFSTIQQLAIDSSDNVYGVDLSTRKVYEYTDTGTLVTSWGTGGSPQHMAIDSSGNVFVGQTSGVQKFNNTGTLVTSWGQSGPGFDSNYVIANGPNGLGVSPTGNVYVSEAHHRIIIYDNSGNFVNSFNVNNLSNTNFGQPQGTAVDSQGNIYTVDFVYDRVVKYDKNGNFLLTFGKVGEGNGQFFLPTYIAIDSFDNVYVSDEYNYRIEKFDSSGNYITQWGTYGTGNGQFTDPQGIAVDSNNNVYVADSDIQEFDSSGNYIRRWGAYGSADGQMIGPLGLAFDSNNHLFVVDAGNNRIEEFDTSGNFIEKFGSRGDGNGQFYFPYVLSASIAIDQSTDDIYVTDFIHDRVEKFDNSGNFITLWGDYGPGNGYFKAPLGVAVGNSSHIYVTDQNNGFVQVFLDSGVVGGGGGGGGTVSYVVNTTSDIAAGGSNDCTTTSGHTCSLRAAIQTANSNGGNPTITVPSGTFTITIDPPTPGVDEAQDSQGDFDITTSMTINGAGSANTIVDANHKSRGFDIHSPANVTIKGVTVKNGTIDTPGGGIANAPGSTLTLSDVIAQDNTSSDYGGGLNLSGTATVDKSTISSNTGKDAVHADGTLTMTDSTVDSNTNQGGNYGGIYIGAGSLDRVTVSDNTASTTGTKGGGVTLGGNNVSLTNVTISGNSASQGGGVYVGSTGNTLTNVTIASNTTDQSSKGAGIYVAASKGLAIKNSILDSNKGNNTTADNCDNAGTLTSNGHNFSSDTTCTSFFNQTGDQNNVDSKLDKLADNGGYVKTLALLADSPAIDAADNIGCPSVDARGTTRPQIGKSGNSAICDAGAYEYMLTSNATPTPTPTPTPVQVEVPPGSSPTITNSSATDTTVTLTFTSADPPVTDYEISYGKTSNDDSSSVTFKPKNIKIHHYSIINLKPDTDYYFKVRAKNGNANSNWSNTKKQRTLPKQAVSPSPSSSPITSPTATSSATPITTPSSTINPPSSSGSTEENNTPSIVDIIGGALGGVIDGANTAIVDSVTNTTENLPEPLNHQVQQLYQSMETSSFVQQVTNASKIVAAATGVLVLLPRFLTVTWPKMLDMPSATQRRLELFPLIFLKKKKRRPWGIVYDSLTKQPVDPAVVTLYKVDGKSDDSKRSING